MVRDILARASDDITVYDEYEDNIHGNTRVVTVYVPDEDWNPVKRSAFLAGDTLSTIVRKGLAATLSEGAQTATHI